MVQRISGLGEIAARYDNILCDVWGVVHNGVACWPTALDALQQFRKAGGTVVMITNAPRPNEPVRAQMAGLNVLDDTYDAVVTSGDVTRKLLSKVDGPLLHIGPQQDRLLYEGQNLAITDDEAVAVAISCTGLFNDEKDKPEDYIPLFERLKQRNLPLICANPDIVVERGDRLVWCGGALAREYSKMGGEVRISGKPHKPIYEEATALLSQLNAADYDRARTLAIGDGVMTDVSGARDFGLDMLFVSHGIHLGEYNDPNSPQDEQIDAFLAKNNVAPVAHLPQLQW